MKNIFDNINKAFESRVRLGIMSILMVESKAEFTTLKETLKLTDGNLASHLKALEEAAYIRMKKQFIGRKPCTTYSATASGKKAFREHLDVLEQMILTNRKSL